MRQTSIDAYNGIRDQLPQKQLQVFNALRRMPMTGAELNDYLETHSAHKRLSELQRKGMIHEQRTRPCSISGKSAIEWGVEPPQAQRALF